MAKASKFSTLAAAVLLMGTAAVPVAARDFGRRSAIRDFNRRAAQRSLLLPGWGQWTKGHRGSALALGGATALALGSSYVNYQRSRTARDSFRAGDASFSRHTRKVDAANFYLLAAGLIWGYSVADAYLGEPRFDVLPPRSKDDAVRLAWTVPF